jgi:peptidoglycan/xylan/chitin deacetylase (PgdA/CDA1 family)
MRSVTDDVDANGCPATATMFVTSTGTDCELLVDLYRSGYEIGDHTISHKSFLTQSYSQLENEILGARERIAACGIPESAIQGLRAPFLEIKGDVWEILADNGFLYDSSLIENTQGNSVSEDFSVRTWPWDMANGFPINCGW